MVDPDCIPPVTRLTVDLIKPSKYDDDGYVIRYRKGFLPSNTLSCLAGLTEDVRRRGVLGDSVTVTVQLFDDTVQPIPVARIGRAARRKGNKTIIGLVGVQTNQFPRAADLALAFRREGVDVLLGGFHVSGSMAMLPAVPPEIQALIDAGVCLVLGEVEDQWGGILTDALRGALRPVYNFLGSPPDLRDQPLPRTDRRYLRRFVTANFGTIDCGRGCPFQCSFCTIINVQGRRMRCRDAETVVAGVRDNYRVNGVSFYFLTDDNFSRNPHWEAIFDGLIALREVERIPIEFMMQVDTLAYRIQGFIPKARRAGCTQVFIGLESLNPRNLAAVNKNQNKVEDLAQMVAAFHREEIMTHAAYIVGFPFDTRASVRQDIERLKSDLGVKQASFFMLIPLPGSHDHREMVKANIPMDPDLNRYDSVHATTDHPLMSADEWKAAFRDAWASFYSFENMKNILLHTSPERYWNVFKNFFWAKSSIFIEGQHPMAAGYFRRKDRRDRRPGFPVVSLWRHAWNRLGEMRRKLAGWGALFMEMEELWLQTRRRSRREQLIAEEIRTIRSDVREWRQLRIIELQEAYRRVVHRSGAHPTPVPGEIRVPSRVVLFFRKHSVLSDPFTDTRNHLAAFWRRTMRSLRHGRLSRIPWHRIPVCVIRETRLALLFTIAMFAKGIR
jgi:radical SAM superfamily enzyme YgiQ (UPF0313 family)